MNCFPFSLSGGALSRLLRLLQPGCERTLIVAKRASLDRLAASASVMHQLALRPRAALLFDTDDAKRCLTNILQGMRREWFSPQHLRRLFGKRRGTSVQQHCIRCVSSNEVTPAQDVMNCGQLVRMHWRSFTWRYLRIENTDSVIFQKQPMV